MGLINIVNNWYQVLKIIHSDKKRIYDIQQQRLRGLLRHAVANSEFYRDLYKEIDPENCSLHDLPVVTKAMMMDNYNRFVTDKRLKFDEIHNWLQDKENAGKYYLSEFSPFLTSGSTGENALIIYHRKALEAIQANMIANFPFQPERSILKHVLTIAGYLFGKKNRLAAITTPGGNVTPLFKRTPGLHRLFMEIKIFSHLDPIEQTVAELNKFQPNQLISLTFFIAQLAQEQIAGRLKLSFNHSLAAIAGASEILTEHTQELADKAWNIKIQDTYGAMECYHMASSCSLKGHLHLMSHLCIIEIVDRQNRPVPKGQYGEKILVTNLFNYTQPIIRYEIEDVTGYANQDCQCGSPFPILLPLQGRAKEFLYFKRPDGEFEQLSPNIFYITIRNMIEVRQYQIAQTGRNELTFIYVLKSDAPDIKEKLKEALTKALAKNNLEKIVTLRFRQVESIPRDRRSGKYRPVISLGPPHDQISV